ncbi:MAG: ABC transporter permease [Clostridia bacterium]|nr:ABC transporter permease [Clostridia bacterium]
MWDFLTFFVPRAVMQGMPLLYGSTGEILTEKAGNLNLGIPGIMYVGAISGVIGAFFYEQATVAAGKPMVGILAVLIPILCCLLGSFLMGLLYCFLTVSLRANQNVTGLAMTMFGVGFGNFFGATLIKLAHSEVPSLTFADTCNFFGDGKHPGWMAYAGIGIALLAALFLRFTRKGMQLRAVGENPATADAAGINVTRYKYVATLVGSMIAGLGGLYYVMEVAHGTWSNEGFGDRGWLAIALVIFTTWRPGVSILASILFGGLYILNSWIQPPLGIQELYKLAPYVVTLLVLIFVSLRKKRENLPPQSLGLSYFREER